MPDEWIVDAPDLAGELGEEFAKGQIIDDAGRRYLTEALVGAVGGLKVEIFSREHPPPHFRVSYQGETANFAIKDCRNLTGGLEHWERTIRKWHGDNKSALIEKWNSTRPADCPVGPYVEDNGDT